MRFEARANKSPRSQQPVPDGSAQYRSAQNSLGQHDIGQVSWALMVRTCGGAELIHLHATCHPKWLKRRNPRTVQRYTMKPLPLAAAMFGGRAKSTKSVRRASAPQRVPVPPLMYTARFW